MRSFALGTSNLAIDCLSSEGVSISSRSVGRALKAAGKNFDKLLLELMKCIASATDAKTENVSINRVLSF